MPRKTFLGVDILRTGGSDPGADFLGECATSCFPFLLVFCHPLECDGHSRARYGEDAFTHLLRADTVVAISEAQFRLGSQRHLLGMAGSNSISVGELVWQARMTAIFGRIDLTA
ncbi:MAG: hypothetical protein OXI87_09865 [Albidovulum sp.]|nr:hypothetical protein [Albidovulum sp.]MDE0305174.1 hypothetical protein [Albidovulum sp.]MDE0530236.1 hypothetical protein [Albidovulum sp.]